MAAAGNQDASKWLAGAAKRWDEEKKKAIADGVSTAFSEGDYLGRLKVARFEQYNGSMRSRLEFKVEGGEFDGKTIRKFDGLDREDAFYYLTRSLASLGVDPEDITAKELPSVYAKLEKAGGLFRLKCTINKGYPNFYIQGPADDGAAGSEEEEDGEESEETEEAEDEDTEEEEDEETEDEEEASTELAVGMKVVFTWKGNEETGEVVELKLEEEKVRIKKDSDGKIAAASVEAITGLVDGEEETVSDEDEDEEEEAPKKPAARKAGAKK